MPCAVSFYWSRAKLWSHCRLFVVHVLWMLPLRPLGLDPASAFFGSGISQKLALLFRLPLPLNRNGRCFVRTLARLPVSWVSLPQQKRNSGWLKNWIQMTRRVGSILPCTFGNKIDLMKLSASLKSLPHSTTNLLHFGPACYWMPIVLCEVQISPCFMMKQDFQT